MLTEAEIQKYERAVQNGVRVGGRVDYKHKIRVKGGE